MMEEVHKQFHLPTKFQIGLEYGLDISNVHTIDLGRVYLSFSFIDSRMKAYCSKIPGQFSFFSSPLAIVQEALVAKFHIIDIAYADDTFVLIDTVNGKFQCHRLHKSIFSTFFDISAGQI